MFPALLILTSRGIYVIIAMLAPHLVSYLGFFPYKEILHLSHLPRFLYSFANFDGVHYVMIAQKGYTEFTQAFFPLYPLSIYILDQFTGNHIVAALLISNICFAVGLTFFHKLTSQLLSRADAAFWGVLMVICYPTSFFFATAYTESLFFMLTVLTFYFTYKKNSLAAGICAFFAALTRLMGIFLVIPLVLRLFSMRRHYKHSWIAILAPLFPLAGFAVYAIYLQITTGDPFFFLHAQPAFGAHRSATVILFPQVIYRYIKIFMTAAHNFQYYISLLEFITMLIVGSVLMVDLYRIIKSPHDERFWIRLGLNLFSCINLMIPTVTGTLSSIPRYSLLSLSFFIAVYYITSKPAKIIILSVMILLQVVLLTLYLQGYFIS